MVITTNIFKSYLICWSLITYIAIRCVTMWPLSVLTVCSSDNSCLMYCKVDKIQLPAQAETVWLHVCLPFWKVTSGADRQAAQQRTVQWHSSVWQCHVVCRASALPRQCYTNSNTSPGDNSNVTLTANKSDLLKKSEHLLTLCSRQSTKRPIVHGLGNVYIKKKLLSPIITTAIPTDLGVSSREQLVKPRLANKLCNVLW